MSRTSPPIALAAVKKAAKSTGSATEKSTSCLGKQKSAIQNTGSRAAVETVQDQRHSHSQCPGEVHQLPWQLSSKFIANYAKLVFSISELAKDSVPWQWTHQQDNAFLTIKAALQQAPVLSCLILTNPS
ncbi:unnamed protein product [Aphanomyces euteiches]